MTLIDHRFLWVPEPADFPCPHCSRLLDRAPSETAFSGPSDAVVITGREPLLSPDLPALVDRLHREGASHVKLRTHGDALAEGPLLADLYRRNLLAYDLELFGPQASVHDGFSGRIGSFRVLDLVVERMWDTPPVKFNRQMFYFELHVPILDARRQALRDVLKLAKFWKAHRVVFDLRTLKTPTPDAVQAVLDVCRFALERDLWATALGLPLCLSEKQFGWVGELFVTSSGLGHYADDCGTCAYRPKCPGLTGPSAPHRPTALPEAAGPEWESYLKYARTMP